MLTEGLLWTLQPGLESPLVESLSQQMKMGRGGHIRDISSKLFAYYYADRVRRGLFLAARQNLSGLTTSRNPPTPASRRHFLPTAECISSHAFPNLLPELDTLCNGPSLVSP